MVTASDYRVVERAIRYLDMNHLRQPSLDDLANHMALSRSHIQRVFTRWAGVSPKRFLQFLTLEHAKGLLEASKPVLATSFASGLSGPGRLHDLFLSTEGVTPGEYKEAGLGVRIRFGVHPTPFGSAMLGLTDRGLCHLAFLPSDSSADTESALRSLEARWPNAAVEGGSPETGPVCEAIFGGKWADSGEPLSLFLKGTNFQIQVWMALLRVPLGALTTYSGLASALGNPRASRAVGSAVGKNPIAFLIPCHRVIRTVGSFGDYRWGSARKKAILGWEASKRAEKAIDR